VEAGRLGPLRSIWNAGLRKEVRSEGANMADVRDPGLVQMFRRAFAEARLGAQKDGGLVFMPVHV